MTENGEAVVSASVYLFSDTGSYLGVSQKTDDSGTASFTIPEKAYKFRVDYNGTRYWSDIATILPHEETTIELQLEVLAMNETNNPMPKRYDGEPPRKTVMLASVGTVPGLFAASSQIGEERVYYFINDHLGTPVMMIDEDKNVVLEADYLPFGKAIINTASIDNNFRLPGQVYDSETGLHYNWHRYYDPAIGRYLRADPIGLAGMDPNLYGCVSNNPVNLADPWGLDPFSGIKQPMRVPAFRKEVSAYCNIAELSINNTMDTLNSSVEIGMQDSNMVIDQAVQLIAVKLTDSYISPVTGWVLRKVNFLLGIFEPFPKEAEAPTLQETEHNSSCKQCIK